jgi:hypothetical protein
VGLARRDADEDAVTPPNGLAGLEARYGKLLLGPDPRNGGLKIISPIGWEAKWMKVSTGLPGLPDDRRIFLNVDLEQPLRNALAAALSVSPGYAIRTLGCFNPRYKRVNAGAVSVHAYGLAVDINAAQNPMGDELVTDMPQAFIEAFKAEGFTWGGEFSGKKDAMHFQWCAGY